MTSVFSWENPVRLCPASFCATRPGMIKFVTVSSFIIPRYYSPTLSWNAYTFILFQGGRMQRKDETISRKDSNLIYVLEGNLHNLEKKNLFILIGLSFPMHTTRSKGHFSSDHLVLYAWGQYQAASRIILREWLGEKLNQGGEIPRCLPNT